jgi:uncharacterized membrane protein YdcZ (DUF606 family)
MAVVAGMIVMGLSPSFVDWQQSPELRPQMYAYYGVAILLVAFGLWDGE